VRILQLLIEDYPAALGLCLVSLGAGLIAVAYLTAT
jgi:hypothetical protein